MESDKDVRYYSYYIGLTWDVGDVQVESLDPLKPADLTFGGVRQCLKMTKT